jgi:hypothetical protein
MKKILSLLLAVLVIAAVLPAAAEDADPIIGFWYADMETADGPKSLGNQNFTRYIVVIAFEPDGTIIMFEVDFAGVQLTYDGKVVGEWEKTGSGYHTKVLGVGEYDAQLSQDQNELLAVMLSPDVLIRWRKMVRLDWYKDIVRVP